MRRTLLAGVLAGLGIALLTLGFTGCGSGSGSPAGPLANAEVQRAKPAPDPSVIATITAGIGTRPYGVAVNTTANLIYVTNAISQTISVISGTSNTVVATIPLPLPPTAIAVDGNYLYVTAGAGSVLVIDVGTAGTGSTLVATLPVGDVPWGIAVNPNTHKVYVANNGNNSGSTVSVIDGTTNPPSVLPTAIGVGTGPYGVAVDPGTNRIYVSNTISNTVSVIDGATDTVIATIPVGAGPEWLAVDPSRHLVYVNNYGLPTTDDGTVSVIDGRRNRVVATISVGGDPYAIAVNPSIDHIYVTQSNNTANGNEIVQIIDGKNNKVIATVTVGDEPTGIAVNPNTGLVYVANHFSNSVSVIQDAISTPGVSAASVTGGGWIDSQAGAYTPKPSLAGKASFSFVCELQKGAMVPTGETQFQFPAARLDFHSTAYEALVITGAKAQYQGTGTINGSGSYGFLVSVIDGQISGGGGVDRFRIKIWDTATATVVYDNQPGAADTADPTTALRSGSIVIHG